ncbi:hypothetical protein N7E81_15335 [Reichenbachiella carrageenanivorans]|uniref:Uncharacterized protein n=1 Tax=Reichenbachiella carrageenanivorans TaxID=2979869 RepID=A0ABY6CXT3_9BACT|nr:hypothetical protein [Reichenbachiella carrageenanivorans]UXX78732.1 hypothetical protein N7E81_15335 [Reichenbachiella carrageenanivorans]
MKSLTVTLLMCLFSCAAFAQTMEDRVTNYLEVFLEENKGAMTKAKLSNTRWATTDAMGGKSISFNSNGRFVLKTNGFQALENKRKGKWYINNEYVVLEEKKEKTPLYVLKNENQMMLVGDEQVDILKQLLVEASYKDGALKPYSYEEIFTFLNGMIVQN